MNGAPRPLVVRGGESGGEQSALSTLVIARMLPQLTAEGSGGFSEIKGDSADGSLRGKAEESARGAAANFLGSGDNE